MAREPKPRPAPETTQEEPTAERPRDEFGFELDHWGLPLAGPERARRLELLGKSDPDEDPQGWADADAASVVSLPEQPAATLPGSTGGDEPSSPDAPDAPGKLTDTETSNG